MFSKKIKVEINDNFNMIQNFINSSSVHVTFKELLQYCIDYQLYEELYVNLSVFEILRNEKNLSLQQSSVKKNLL